MKQVVVECLADGTVKVDACGFTGQSCQKATEEIIKALGKVRKETRKPEYFQANKQTQKAGR